eukprot:g10045.t1
MEPGALLHGFRLGSVVEVDGADFNDRVGQLVSFSEKEETFSVSLINGSTRQVKPTELRSASQSFDILVGPRHCQDFLAEEVANCLMEKGFCVMKLCQSQPEVERAVSSVKKLAESGRLERLPEEVEEGYLGQAARARVLWMDERPSDKVLKDSDELMSTMAVLLQPYCEDALGKMVDARTPGLLSLSLLPSEDVAPMVTDDYTLASFYSTWRRSQLKMMHFFGPGVAKLTLSPKEESSEGEHREEHLIEASTNTVDWLRCIEGPPGPTGGTQINVVNLSSRLMARWDEPEAYRAGLSACTDAGIETLALNAATAGVGAVVVAWERGRCGRAPLAGSSCRSDDYDHIPKPPDMVGSANVQAIIANRFSFIFNLKGPNYVADTACSASLTATHLAKFMLRDQTIDKLEFHVALGIHQCLSPLSFDVIWKAIREAKISPVESCVWSCHGTGTSLGDPIEVGAVRKIQNKEPRDTTLIVVTNKATTGHLEGGAAMTSLIAAVFQVKSSLAVPVCHLRQLNPHLDQTGFQAFFNSELGSYNYSQGIVHVSSFGFGGTNAHAIFWGEERVRTLTRARARSGCFFAPERTEFFGIKSQMTEKRTSTASQATHREVPHARGSLRRGPPMMPKLPSFCGGAPQSQADFAQQMMKMGFLAKAPQQVPNDGTAVMGPAPKGRPSMEDVQFLPERPDRRPPGPPPKVGAGADVRKAPPSTGGLQDLPPNVKPPPPPPKKAAGGEAVFFLNKTLGLYDFKLISMYGAKGDLPKRNQK